MITRIVPAGDIALVDGSYVIDKGVHYTRTRLAARLQFFLGEYFLDRRLGVPYFRYVFVRNPNLDLIRLLYRRVITTCPGIVSLNKLELNYQPRARKLGVSFHATAEDGNIIVEPGDEQFIISLEAA